MPPIASSLRLIIHSESGADVLFPLREGDQTIGRLPENDIQLIHQSISRTHATISVSKGRVRISDKKSRNGTYLNGRQVTAADAVVGDLVKFGSIQGRIAEPGVKTVVDWWQSESTINQKSPSREDPRLDVLTPAQRRVFWKLIDGKSEREIADELGIARDTAHNHKRTIYGVFGVSTHAELVATFRRLGGTDVQGSGP